MYTSILTLLVISVYLCGTWAQLCIPDPVDSVDLVDSTLSWTSSQNCPNTQYEIHILTGDVIEYDYNIDGTSLDVSFLSFCKTYTFAVIPIADNVIGIESTTSGSIALPSDANIVVANLTGDPIEQDVLIQWHIDETYRYCVSYYRVIRWNEDSSGATYLYTSQKGVLLQNVARCMTYRFEISTYTTSYGDVAEFNYTVPATPNEPTLVEVKQTAVTIDTTWSLEKFSVNRCQVTTLLVNSTRFNETITIEDSPERPDVQVNINGLKANSMYYFDVSTVNSAGESRPFRMSVQTLPVAFADEQSMSNYTQE